MLIEIPIGRLQLSKCSGIDNLRSIWDRKRELGLQPPPLDYWGRHKNYFDSHGLQKQFDIPHAVQLGHGDMHLDDWFEPDQLVRHAASDGVFEVRMNVADFKPHELKLTLDESSRLVTIEGRHHEHHVEHSESQDHRRSVTRSGSLHAHFKRSFTLSKAVFEQEIECKLTHDGHHLIFTAPVLNSLAAMAPHRPLCAERGRCADLVKCICTTTDELKRG